MEAIRAKIIPNKVLFRDEESGFKIYSADIKESEYEVETNNYGNISIKGNNLPDFNLGSVYDLGLVKNSRDKYKGSYTMIKNHFVKPQTPEEQWKFLSMVVTESQLESIASRYVEDNDAIIDIILEGDFDYDNVYGYGESTAEALRIKVKKDLDISEALAYFSEYEISYNLIKRLVENYGSSEVAIKKIEENPYAIIEKNGFGFIKADDLAMKLGISPESKHRIKSCMIYILEDINNNGEIWIERKKLYNKMKKILKIKKELIDEIIDGDNDEVFIFKERYSTLKSAKNEMFISQAIADKVINEESLLSQLGYNPSEFIKSFEEKNSLKLSPEQKEFLYKLDKTNLLFLVGNAGTGKSMIQKIIIEIADSLALSYALLAPTGKASRVLTNYTQRQAYTIHKKIGFGGFEEVTEIKEDIVLVDEASMCDVNIANKLMSVLKRGSLVIFIGDDAQIPSVGEGNFLYDCINSDKVPKIKLNKVFRQKESGMLDAITMTRQGKAFLNTTLVSNQRIGNNFEFRHMMKEEIVSNLIESYRKLMNAGYKYDEVGVLVPTNIGDIGAVEINRAIQEEVNPQNDKMMKDEHEFGNSKTSRVIRVGDYVMNTENMYQAQVTNSAKLADVFNGECGIVVSVSESRKEIIVDFDGDYILYDFSDAMKKLSHAWANTIHKSQGSQYDIVLAVVDASATYQLNANLLYTAMSRAKKFLGVFGQAKTYNRALRKFSNFSRNSFLGEFLEYSFSINSMSPSDDKWEEDVKDIVKLLRNDSNFI